MAKMRLSAYARKMRTSEYKAYSGRCEGERWISTSGMAELNQNFAIQRMAQKPASRAAATPISMKKGQVRSTTSVPANVSRGRPRVLNPVTFGIAGRFIRPAPAQAQRLPLPHAGAAQSD